MNNCSNHGNCTGPNECTCEKGFQAEADCSKVSCESLDHCFNHGNCSGPNVCSCHSGFKGLNCSQVTCEALNNCSNHGSCIGPNECTCEEGFQGTDCSEVLSEEQGGSLLSRAAVVGLSIGAFVLLLLLLLLLIYCCKKRKLRRYKMRSRPQRTDSTVIFSNPAQVPTSAWVFPRDFPRDSERVPQADIALYSFDNQTYSMAPLKRQERID
ncbi:hypothetical protein OS493_010265 [Desmophyllum pertusum]|uniref:EGF-like domain-containing protein n=1 Tax=Desmophyllum pertusum TaxID=174260 RepID=A0A9X0A4F9_9CNID|nr:hypothetical protein OS493_010265 [Desmophyllum pertusum]